jgi:hypothetical protein
LIFNDKYCLRDYEEVGSGKKQYEGLKVGRIFMNLPYVVGSVLRLMDDTGLSFRIAVNTNKETIIEIIKNSFKELNLIEETVNQFELRNNNIVIARNDDFDFALTLTDVDSFLYYEYNIDFYPIKFAIALDEQILLAKKIKKAFEECSIKSEIISEFEHLL